MSQQNRKNARAHSISIWNNRNKGIAFKKIKDSETLSDSFFIETLKVSAHPVPVSKDQPQTSLTSSRCFQTNLNAAQTRHTREQVDVITPTGNMEQSDTPEPAGLTKLQLQTCLQTRYHYYHLHTKQILDRRQTCGCITFLKAHKYMMRPDWTQKLCIHNMYRTILYDL